MLLTVENNLDRQPSTLSSYLAANGTAGGTIVPVKNINGFTANWAVQLGRTGEETAEIQVISGAPSGTVLNTAGTARFPHALDTPIFQTHYDKVVFLRSTSGTTGVASSLATVSITPDSFYTEYDDSSGASTYAYQVQYYNSVSGDVSGTSAWFIPGGPTWFSLQRLRDRAKKALYNANYITDDTIINDWVNEWIEQMTNAALKVNQAYSVGTASYAFGTAGLGTITAPLFKYASKIEVTYDGVRYTQTTEIPLNRFSDGDTFSSLQPKHYWQGNTVFGVLPTGNAGTARMSLGQLSSEITNDTDEVPQFLKGYTAQCIEYVLYRAYDKDSKDDQADKHYQRHLIGKKEFLAEITPRDQTGVKMIDLTENLSGMNEDLVLSSEYFL